MHIFALVLTKTMRQFKTVYNLLNNEQKCNPLSNQNTCYKKIQLSVVDMQTRCMKLSSLLFIDPFKTFVSLCKQKNIWPQAQLQLWHSYFTHLIQMNTCIYNFQPRSRVTQCIRLLNKGVVVSKGSCNGSLGMWCTTCNWITK